MAKAKLKALPATELLRLDLGCGPNKREGFVGVDALPFDGKVDYVVDLRQTPWRFGNRLGSVMEYDEKNGPFQFIETKKRASEMLPSFGHKTLKDASVDEVYTSHFLEHLTGAERVGFFNELYRVMRKDAKAQIIVPHWASGRAYGDPTHQWPPVVEFFWYYLDKGWRDANAPHAGLTCDFLATWGYSVAPAWQVRSQEAQMFGINHYREVAQDMLATVVKR